MHRPDTEPPAAAHPDLPRPSANGPALQRTVEAALGIGAGALIAIVLTLVALGLAARWQESWVAHSRDVLRIARTGMNLAIDRETGIRGWLVTGDRASLAPADAAATELPVTLDSLATLTADNAVQHRHARDIATVMAAWERSFADSVLGAADLATARALAARRGAGRPEFDRVRVVFADFIDAEEALYRRRRRRSRMLLLGVVGVVGAELVVLALALLAQRERMLGLVRQQHRQQELLEEQAITLEEQNERLGEQAHRLAAQAGTLEVQRQALAQANASLTARVEELRAFSYSVAHDLRSPLRGIDGYAAMLGADLGERVPPESRRHLDRLRANAQRMGQLIDGVLSLARLTSREPELEPLDLTAMAHEVARELERTVPHGVQWRIADGLTAAGDARLVRSALENLLGNAAKFTRDAAAPVVEVGALESMDEIPARAVSPGPPGLPVASPAVFFVRDNGVGLDVAHAAQLFRSFHRLHAQLGFEGTGVGLASVRRIVERHGGQVWIDGVPGSGATVYFTLPAAGASPS